MQIDEKKAKIIEVLKARGPSLPNHISKEIETSTLITSAFLSEMASNKIIKISSLKVGSSPLYFLPGQEQMLENFISYLPKKEKEVFLLLKKAFLVEDEKLPPQYSIAIRNIKDFAVSIKARREEQEKFFWKFYTFSDEEAANRIKSILEKREKKEKIMTREKAEEKIKRAREKTDEALMKAVEEYAKTNNIKIIKEVEKKKNEFDALVSFNSAVGEMHFLLVAKKKKSISEADIILAYKKGQNAKAPVIFLTNGRATKKAQQCMNEIGKVFIFKELQ